MREPDFIIISQSKVVNYDEYSISKRMKTYTENPLTYHEVAGRYNFKLEKIVYPPSHLMPPFLED